MPKCKNKRKTAVNAIVKDNICKAAMNILSKHHPKYFTMELVAREVGMTRGTLYKYFKNKSALIAYVILIITQPYEERVKRVIDSDMTVRNKLLAIAELNISIAGEKREFLLAMFDTAPRSRMQQEAQESIRQEGEHITKIIKSGLREGVFRKLPAADLVTAYFAIVRGFANRRLLNKSKRSAAEDAKMAINIFMSGASAHQP